MKIRILARKRNNYSNRRLREESKELGYQLSVVDPLTYEIAIGTEQGVLFQNGRRVNGVDVVLPRSGASITNYSLAVIIQFERMSVPILNSSESIIRTRNKLRCLQWMTQYGIDIPRTVFIRKPGELASAVEMVGGFPVVMKLVSGTQGIGVMLAEKLQAIESTIDTLWNLGQDILIQECIQESVGRDVRVIVVGGKIVAAMRRQARIGEFRSNLHRGGIASPIALPESYKKLAIKAAKVSGLEVAGVDLLEANSGPKLIEVNSSPGLEGVERATGINVARAILEHAAKVASGKKVKLKRA